MTPLKAVKEPPHWAEGDQPWRRNMSVHGGTSPREKAQVTTSPGGYGERAKSIVSFAVCGFHYKHNYSRRLQNEHVLVQFGITFLGKGQFLWAEEKSDASGLYEFRTRWRRARLSTSLLDCGDNAPNRQLWKDKPLRFIPRLVVV